MSDNIKSLMAASQYESSTDPAYCDLSKAADAEIDRLIEIAGCLRHDMRTAERIIDDLQKRIAELEAAMIENGRVFASYGDHVRQAGCYAIAGLDDLEQNDER